MSDLQSQDLLESSVRVTAEATFDLIVKHFDLYDLYTHKSYSRAKLIDGTYKWVQSGKSKDRFLRMFFMHMELPMDSIAELDFQELAPRFEAFAKYLMDSFFIPIKAAGGASRLQAQGAQNDAAATEAAMTPSRVSTLRNDCLKRDRHRCVISRKFDLGTATAREKEDEEKACDDDGLLFHEQELEVDTLEVAHIIPHSMMKRKSDAEYVYQDAHTILDMFDNGVVAKLAGVAIDRPFNALTLSRAHRLCFGAFDTYFDDEGNPEGTYTIRTFENRRVVRSLGLPVTRTLLRFKDHTIGPPSPRLLAIHRAIARILNMSGAGEYIDEFLLDMGSNKVRSDGSTDLGAMVHRGLATASVSS